MAKVNRNALVSIVTKGMGSVAWSAAKATAAIINHETKEIMLKEFDEHPVTQEIQAGPKSQSLSGILKGIKGRSGQSGNLFSFIGFTEGSNPTKEVRNALNRYSVAGMFKGKKDVNTKNGTVTFHFPAYLPSSDEIEEIAVSSSPDWMGGRSWIHGIENGFDNLKYYLYRRKGFGPNANSLSGTGLQVKTIHNPSGKFKTTPYTTPILANALFRSTGVVIRGVRAGKHSFTYTNYNKTFKGFFDKLKGTLGLGK